MRLVRFLLGAALVGTAGPASAAIVARIDNSQQRMRVRALVM